MDRSDLQTKIELLRSSTYFAKDSADGALVEKQAILLVLCQQKPVAEATSGHWVQTEDGRHSEPEDHTELGKFLSSLGLAFSLHSDEYATDAIVALDQSLVDEFVQADDAATVGRLFGYPPTATEAFVNDELMSLDEQDALMQAHGLPLFMPTFRLSQLHGQDEIKVLQEWYRTLRAYDFV